MLKKILTSEEWQSLQILLLIILIIINQTELAKIINKIFLSDFGLFIPFTKVSDSEKQKGFIILKNITYALKVITL